MYVEKRFVRSLLLSTLKGVRQKCHISWLVSGPDPVPNGP